MYEYRATVVRVIDGDTIVVDLDLGFSVTFRTILRLASLDTWEMRGEERERGMLAKLFVVNRLGHGDRITVQTEKTGKYGRYIAEINYGPFQDKNLNQELRESEHVKSN